MAWIGTAAEEAKMPLTSMSILAIAFECATTDWSIGGLVEKLDSGAWHTACWEYAVGAATSLQNKRVKSPSRLLSEFKETREKWLRSAMMH